MRILLLFLLMPRLVEAQDLPRFENDTLYTLSGYKIYVGQTLQFGKATGMANKFNYVNIKNGIDDRSLENNYIIVKELKNFKTSTLGNSYIDILGNITFKDESKGYIDMRLNFDYAIGNLPQVPGELVVSEEFRNANKFSKSLYMPHLGGDTLYTSCGFKIYKGQTLQFGRVTGDRERFRYINIKNRVPPLMLQYHSILVRELKDFGISAIGNAYITITGILVVNNNERGDIIIHMAFDHAIENLPDIPSELIVPNEFRNKLMVDPTQEIDRLDKLYWNGTITLDLFESYKKKLLQY